MSNNKLMFWNKQNANQNQNSETKNGKKNWLHAPDALVNGHVAYLVKFLGSTPVDQAKGIETVKDAIRRLQFAQQLKKAESGNNFKTKKVEITISVDGVAVQEPRAQKVLHQFPLHNISYCADEKGVKKFFSFIAKTNNSVPNGDTTTTITTNNADESHECFVFVSSKLASDITLTIGQAFELAYRRYMNDNGKGTEISKLQSQNQQLENTVSAYRQRLKDLVEILPKSDLDRLLLRHGLRDILEVPQQNGLDNHVASINGNKTPDLGIDVSSPNNDDQLLIETSPKHFAPIVPPRNLQNQINSTLEAFKPSVGTKLEGLLLNSDSDSDFDPRADESETNSSSTTASLNGNGNKISNDFFGFEPPKTMGQHLFTNPVQPTNGVNGTMNGHQVSPPPLLAPPPKASIPRRSNPSQPNNNNNNSNIANNNSSQDLFGSTPFNAMQTNSFEDTIGYGAFNISSSSFETNPNPSINITTTMTTSGTSLNVNPFEKSGINLNKVTDVQSTHGFPAPDNTCHDIPNPFMPSQQSVSPTMNGLDGISFANKINPFALSDGHMQSGTLTLDVTNGHGGKYDAFRSSSFELNHRVEEIGGDVKTVVDLDLFKDAAAAAFSEFGKSKHEYKSSKVAETNAFKKDARIENAANGKNNFNKSIGFSADDFTLESLDPLRK